MQFVDKAFARRLESCEEMPQVFYAREFRKSRPELGAAEEEVCGGHMVFAGLGSPIGRATGAGFDRPLTPDDLNRIEHFYRERKAPSQVDLTPMHEPTPIASASVRPSVRSRWPRGEVTGTSAPFPC